MKIRLNPFKAGMKAAKKNPKTAVWAVLLEKGIKALHALAEIGERRLKKLEDAAKKGTMSVLVLVILLASGCAATKRATVKVERTCWPMIIKVDKAVTAVEEYEIGGTDDVRNTRPR